MDWKWSLMTLLMIDTITLEQMSKWNSIIAFKMDCLVLLSKSIKVACKNKTAGCFFYLLFLKCKTFCAMDVTHLPAKGSRYKYCGGGEQKWLDRRLVCGDVFNIKIKFWLHKDKNVINLDKDKKLKCCQCNLGGAETLNCCSCT